MSGNQSHLNDIREIRGIIENNTRFLSLSGLSGIFAGVSALLGSAVAKWYLIKEDIHFTVSGTESLNRENLNVLLGLAAVVFLLALLSVWFFTARHARMQKRPVNNKASRRWLIHLSIPMLTGGLFCFILISQGTLHLIPSLMLVFYGMGLLNAGKFTFEDISVLGLLEIVLGLMAVLFPFYGLLLWTLGFGALHVIYGALVYFKYNRG